jgi:hypothetical protein
VEGNTVILCVLFPPGDSDNDNGATDETPRRDAGAHWLWWTEETALKQYIVADGAFEMSNGVDPR